MSIIEAIILGLVQGLTEFIPVSSSGHLIAGHELFGTNDSTLLFDVALHVGTFCALLIYFRRDVWRLISSAFSRTSSGALARIIVLATIPAAVVGFFASEWIDDVLRTPETVVVTMTMMGLLMLYVEKWHKSDKKITDVTTKNGIIVGIAQACALIPGVSRSGATIMAGMMQGFERPAAAKLSFLMAIPITAGAIMGSMLGIGGSAIEGEIGVFVVGIFVSFLSGLFAIRFLMNYLNRHSLSVFAYYRLVFAALLLLTLLV